MIAFILFNEYGKFKMQIKNILRPRMEGLATHYLRTPVLEDNLRFSRYYCMFACLKWDDHKSKLSS